jgi:hypothetical protein
MKHTLINQGKRAGIALAAVAALTALGTGNLQAARPANTPTFVSADIALDRFGNLECQFRETGLTPGGTVRYDCRSQYVGVLQQCMLKNQPVGNSQLLIFQDIHPEEVENMELKTNGSVNATILTQVPESESNALLCTAPSELEVTSVRWCNNSLLDLTHNITGATVPELFAVLVSNASGTVPSCEDLANGPFTTPGE